MRLSRNRNYGQPEMVQFLMDLSATARDIGFGRGFTSVTSASRGAGR